MHVAFDPEDVRAGGRAGLPNIWVVHDQDAPEVILMKWEATATNTKRRVGGEIENPMGTVRNPAQLLEEPADGEDGADEADG